MTITSENDNDIIVYALEKVISYARDNQYIFLAQSIWWIASIIGLTKELVAHIDKLRKQPESSRTSVAVCTNFSTVHPARINQITEEREISATPRDLTEDQCTNQVLDRAERYIEESERLRKQLQQNKVNPFPQTKKQKKKARKSKRLQEARGSAEARGQIQRLRNIRNQVVQNLSRE